MKLLFLILSLGVTTAIACPDLRDTYYACSMENGAPTKIANLHITQDTHHDMNIFNFTYLLSDDEGNLDEQDETYYANGVVPPLQTLEGKIYTVSDCIENKLVIDQVIFKGDTVVSSEEVVLQKINGILKADFTIYQNLKRYHYLVSCK